MSKLIIEARVNEYMMRAQGNPHVPYLPEEIVARVGAIHLRQGPLDAAELIASRFLDHTNPGERRPSEPS